MAELSILLLHWRRWDNTLRLLDCLAAQEPRPEIVVWSNNPDSPLTHPAIDWLVQSSRNAGCGVAVTLLQQLQTPYVAKIDDDLLLADPRVLQDALEQACAHPAFATQVFGWFGLCLVPGQPYCQGEDVALPAVATPVDIVKGRFHLFRREVVQCLPGTTATHHGDVSLSGFLAQGRPRANWLLGGFQERLVELPTGAEAASSQPTHCAEREAARQRFFGAYYQ